MDFHTTEATCYLTAELFCLEVALLPCGGVEDVKLTPHAGCPVVCKCTVQAVTASAQVISRHSVAALRVAPAAAQVRRGRTTPTTALSNADQAFFSFFMSPKGGKLLRVLRQVGRPVEPVQHPRRQVTSRQLLVFLLF